MDRTVSDVLTNAASLLDRGVCVAANARLPNGRATSCFSPQAIRHSMYGALVAVLGPTLGADRSLQTSTAWKMIAWRAWQEQESRPGIPLTAGRRLEFALHDLNDGLPDDVRVRGNLFRRWADEPDIKSIGVWH